MRRKVEEKDLPQNSSAGDTPLLIDWEMSQPPVLPPQEDDSWELAPSPDGQSGDMETPVVKTVGGVVDAPLGQETVTTDLPREPSRVESSDEAGSHPRPDEPVPMSVDSVDPANIPTPGSDESWTELYERTCGELAPAARDNAREKRPRSPDFIPEKRLKQDALRSSFVHNKETIKAHSGLVIGYGRVGSGLHRLGSTNLRPTKWTRAYAG